MHVSEIKHACYAENSLIIHGLTKNIGTSRGKNIGCGHILFKIVSKCVVCWLIYFLSIVSYSLLQGSHGYTAGLRCNR